MTKTTTKKQPSAQVEPAQKASALKVANEAKRAQPDWLRRGSLSPPRETETPFAPERLRTSDRSQGPPWLLTVTKFARLRTPATRQSGAG